MLEKSSDKRISLKEICMSKWFISHYKWQHQDQALLTFPNDKIINKSSTFSKFSEPINESNTRLLKVKKTSKLSVFSNSKITGELSMTADEENMIEEGKINMNTYNLKPKFLNCWTLENNSYLNSAKDDDEGEIKYSIAENMAKKSQCFLEVIKIIFMMPYNFFNVDLG